MLGEGAGRAGSGGGGGVGGGGEWEAGGGGLVVEVRRGVKAFVKIFGTTAMDV